MNGHKEHITHYTAADIQRYVQGKLSAREMHAMEKAALDDPFLADAIEGMQQAFAEHKDNLVTGQLQELQQQFKTRTGAAGKMISFKPFRYWQAAAAAVVVIITGVWAYSLLTRSESPESVIAKTEKHKAKSLPNTEEQPAQQQAPAVAADNEITVSTDSTTVQRTNSNTARKTTAKASEKNEVNAVDVISPAPPAANAVTMAHQRTDSTDDHLYVDRKPSVVAAQQESAVPVTAKAFPEYKKSQKDLSAFDTARERETELITIAKNDNYYKKRSAAVDKNKNNLTGFIKGQVTDQNNNPIANAFLQIHNNKINFYTDKTGFFKIPAYDSVVDVAVNVSGYGTQNFRLQNNASMNQLQLQPANIALNEVEVTSIKVRKQSAGSGKVPTVMEHDAEPVFGWVAFEQYLEKNKKIPADAAAITGNVLVSFQVNKKGTLSDFKIEQSLSKAYDDEAIRLIMQGPSWKLLKGRKARITVMVRF